MKNKIRRNVSIAFAVAIFIGYGVYLLVSRNFPLQTVLVDLGLLLLFLTVSFLIAVLILLIMAYFSHIAK